MANRKDDADSRCPEKCKGCEYRKVISYSAPFPSNTSYNFCIRMNMSFSGGEPSKFFRCGK